MVDGKVFRGQTATVTVETTGGTEVVVGALQDVEVQVQFEDEELLGQSIKVIDRQRTRVGVSVSATFGSFDLAGMKELIGYDDTNEEIEDTPEPPKFNVKGDLESVDGTETITPTVQDVIFDDISWSWSRDTHVEEDISGEGTDMTDL